MNTSHNRIKFHSIYYRLWLFVFALMIMVYLYVLNGGNGMVGWGGNHSIIPVKTLGLYLNLLCVVLFVVCSFAKWKMTVRRDGLYLRKIDLFVPWDEIKGVQPYLGSKP